MELVKKHNLDDFVSLRDKINDIMYKPYRHKNYSLNDYCDLLSDYKSMFSEMFNRIPEDKKDQYSKVYEIQCKWLIEKIHRS